MGFTQTRTSLSDLHPQPCVEPSQWVRTESMRQFRTRTRSLPSAVAGSAWETGYELSGAIALSAGLANSKTIDIQSQDGATVITTTRPKNKSKPAHYLNTSTSKNRVQRQAPGVAKLATSFRPDLKVQCLLDACVVYIPVIA